MFGTNKYSNLINKFEIGEEVYEYVNLEKLDRNKYASLPFCIRILLESLVRNYDDLIVTEKHIDVILNWNEICKSENSIEIPFWPARVLFQDFSAIPALIDIACLRNTCKSFGGDPSNINPICPTDLVLDHAIVDGSRRMLTTKTLKQNDNNLNTNIKFSFTETGYTECPFHNQRTQHADLIEKNRALEFTRCKERLEFLKWSSQSFKNLFLIPPFNGIAHQTNIEYISRIVFNKNNFLYPDTVVGTDTHTSTTNALGVLSLNIGAVETEYAMLGQPIFIQLPQVIGIKLKGTLNEAKIQTSIDIILFIAKYLRTLDLNNKFVEFYGEACNQLTISERETIANMCCDYGSTCAYFPPDQNTLEYLEKAGRPLQNISYIKEYLQKSKLLNDYEADDLRIYTITYDLDLNGINSLCSGPKRSQDKIQFECLHEEFNQSLCKPHGPSGFGLDPVDKNKTASFNFMGVNYELQNGSIVLASIDSYTNACNPSLMLAAGVLAKKAYENGLRIKPYIKCDIYPGSGLLTKHYLTKTGLMTYFELLGFQIFGYGCSQCLENFNNCELDENLIETIEKNQLICAGIFSGNRNFENRINCSITKANYLFTPSLVIAFAIAGRININFDEEPIGYAQSTNSPIYLKDIWPSRNELTQLEINTIVPQIYDKIHSFVYSGDKNWNSIHTENTCLYNWKQDSTFIKCPPFLDHIPIEPNNLEPLRDCRVLLYLTDSITSDCISPAGSIPRNCAAAKYLILQKVSPRDFNSFGSRRGNFEIMSRGIYSSQRLINKLVSTKSEPGKTIYLPKNVEMDIYDAAERYKADKIPLIVIAGKNYGMGSSRDWSFKGPWLLGIKAIIAESFDRAHKISLLMNGILPLKFINNENATKLNLNGKETYTIMLNHDLTIGQLIKVQVNNDEKSFQVQACIDQPIELVYYKNGGFLNYLTRKNSQTNWQNEKFNEPLH